MSEMYEVNVEPVVDECLFRKVDVEEADCVVFDRRSEECGKQTSGAYGCRGG
jgi:hypothetical protein